MLEAASARSLRTAERFLIEPPLSGNFGSAVVAVCDISAKGARFRHGHPVEMGQKSVLKLTVEGKATPVTLEAVVVWTQTESAASGKFVSGVRTYASPELMAGMLKQLQASNRTTRIEEMRSADRFFIAPYLNAQFDEFPVRIEDVCKAGARIESAHQVPVGRSARLRFGVPETDVTAEVAGEVRWSVVKSLGPTRYRAGMFVSDKPEMMRLAIGQLVESGRASIDTHSLSLKLRIIRARARQLAPEFSSVETAGVPAEQYLLVQSVREELRLNPDEAMHWYRRARLLIRDTNTRMAAAPIADHPDALAVWEYLDRSIDPTIIGRTFNLPLK
jgi:hypothetical protein